MCGFLAHYAAEYLKYGRCRIKVDEDDGEAMADVKVHVLHTGEVCVSPYPPFGGADCSVVKASGMLRRASDRRWLPVSSYLIEHQSSRKVLTKVVIKNRNIVNVSVGPNDETPRQRRQGD